MPNSIKKKVSAGLLASALVPAGAAVADENLWIYAQGADTLPQGKLEFKIQDIIRTGKEGGKYTFHEFRPAVEYGITDKLTVGAEILIFHHNYSVSNPDLQPYFDTQGGEGGSFNNLAIGGYEFEAKYNILSTYKDIFGLALGVAYDHRDKYRLDGASINQDSIEVMAFFQKNFLDDTLMFAFTPKLELEKRTSGDGADFVLEEEVAFDFAAGVSYRVAPKWYIGAEFRHQSDYLVPQVIGENGGLVYEEPHLDPSDIDLFFPSIGSQFQNGNYFGPTLHYGTQDWWFTAGALFQISGGGRDGSFNVGNRNFDEHEKVHIGLALGFEF
jgi:opacity protein-like surface antigen